MNSSERGPQPRPRILGKLSRFFGRSHRDPMTDAEFRITFDMAGESSVSLHDAAGYEMLPTAHIGRRQIFDQFTTGFPRYLIQQEQINPVAKELLSALRQLPESHLATAVSLGSEIDWTDKSAIPNIESLFEAFLGLTGVIDSPSREAEDAAREYGRLGGYESSEAPLATNTRWLFQAQNLGVRHGYLWEKYVLEVLARTYVVDKKTDIPKDVTILFDYASGVEKTAIEQAAEGIDNRQIGIGQMLGKLVGGLGKLESSDARYDYTVRTGIAHEVAKAVHKNDQEELLKILLKYLQPVDIECGEIQGAIFKPVVITDTDGKNLYARLQRFDSFWFKPPFEDETPNENPDINLFPDNPQMIDSFFDYDPDEAGDKRVTIYKDSSYFRPDGSKVYWGDLTHNDVSTIDGNYYCLSQSDSFHFIPEWAVRMRSFIDNIDPNRPVESYINTQEGQVALPENPILIDPQYMRAVAIGAIVDGKFIENNNHCEIKFVPVSST